MQAIKCDRCGKYYDEERQNPYMIRMKTKGNLDLCDECYSSLISWLGVDTPAEETEPEETGDRE